ncbi:unnamed protein product [Effrenium voratum]|nr:unnamed protein product [Effrenium voratum]
MFASYCFLLWHIWPSYGSESGWSMQSDEDEGIFKSLVQHAERGDATAQSLLAQDYFYGTHGVKKDIHTAIRWAEAAADAGDRDAQELLAVAFGRGHEDLLQDPGRAVQYGIKAASQGSIKSAELLGKLYYNGTGLEHLSREERMTNALKWFRSAAREGSLTAQNDLADMYRMGQGTNLDYTEAKYWYQKVVGEMNSVLSADHKLPSATRNRTAVARAFNSLGALYALGQGTNKNLKKAAEYLEQAKALGHPHAAQNLKKLGLKDAPGEL